MAKRNVFDEFWNWKVLKLGSSVSKGIIVFFPILIVIFLFSLITGKIDDLGNGLIKLFFKDIVLPPLSGVMAIGLLAYVFGRILIWEQEHKRYFFFRFLKMIPYLGAFFTPRNGSFMKCCLIWWTPSTLTLGLIVGVQKIEGGEIKIVVNFPNPPPTPPMFIDKKYVIKIDLGFEAASQLIASWNTTRPEEFKLIPWEGETVEECCERVKKYPN